MGMLTQLREKLSDMKKELKHEDVILYGIYSNETNDKEIDDAIVLVHTTPNVDDGKNNARKLNIFFKDRQEAIKLAKLLNSRNLGEEFNVFTTTKRNIKQEIKEVKKSGKFNKNTFDYIKATTYEVYKTANEFVQSVSPIMFEMFY